MCDAFAGFSVSEYILQSKTCGQTDTHSCTEMHVRKDTQTRGHTDAHTHTHLILRHENGQEIVRLHHHNAHIHDVLISK